MRNLFKRFMVVLGITCAVVAVSSCESCSPTPTSATYTYNDYMAGSPDTWNPHKWETNEDSYIMGFIEMGLYDFILNNTKDGYEIVAEMAAADPVDVTSTYAGDKRFNVPADKVDGDGYAYKIALNPNARWDDGTPINADTYVYSMEQLLSPTMLNYRADSYYAGSMIIANAKKYYNSQSPIYKNVTYYIDPEDEEADHVFDPDYKEGDKVYINLTSTEMTVAPYSFSELPDLAGCTYDTEAWEKIATAANPYGYTEVTTENKDAVMSLITTYLSCFQITEPEDIEHYYWEFLFYNTGEFSEKFDWENVGLLKTGEYEITIVLENGLKGFDLFTNLAGNWIVKKDLYEACKKPLEGSDGLYTTTYGTDVATTASYGPYKLATYQLDKSFTLAKNDQWYGYTDGKHEGQFQTTNINVQIIDNHATALLEFLKGNLDNISLTADDMVNYRSSDYIQYTPQTYTSKLSFNTSLDKLKAREVAGVDKQILGITEFRKAISLAIDRDDFAAKCTASHTAGFGLLNYMYVVDPDTGKIYRETEDAESVFTRLYGVSSTEGLTGYDKNGAKALFQQAYDKAVEAGYMTASDRVELEFLVYQDDESYHKIVNFVQDAITAATVGTSLEGKVTIKFTADPDYYDKMQSGECEIIISTWGGAQYNPFGVSDCYLNPQKYFEYGFDTKQSLTINVNGEDVSMSLEKWNEELNQGKYVTESWQVKTHILAEIEYFVLSQYCTTPLYYRTDASLNSRKVENGTNQYINLVGFGGIRFLTYHYTDAEWANYCATQNYQLKY